MTPDEPIATRELHTAGPSSRRVEVRLYRPEELADDEWRCRFSVEGLDGEGGERQAVGIDAFQALQLALDAIRAILDSSGRSYRWLGTDEFGTGFSRSVPLSLHPQERARLERSIDESVDGSMPDV